MTIYINVSNTFNRRAKTGIQRVVREVVSRLVCRQDVILIAWSKSAFYQISLAQEVEKFLTAQTFTPQKKVDIAGLQQGDIFFDPDASWGDAYDIKQLYQLLKQQGVILTKLHHDAVPVLFPHFSHPNTVFSYTDNFIASLQYCDYWLCTSQTVCSDLLNIADSIDIGQVMTHVIHLGADFKQSKDTTQSLIVAVDYAKYILVVGTLEPRKNHQLILDVFDLLQQEDQTMNLVIVGKKGWHISDIVERIQNHPVYNRRLFWLNNASDEELAALYTNAYITANLSHYEGYGLPVIESLSYGCVTLCARNTAMEEVAAGAAYCVAADTQSVLDAIKALESPQIYAEFKHKAKQFEVPKWCDSAAEIARFFDQIQQSEDILSVPRQAIYISIRADALHRSLNSVIKNMPFITQAVILTSDEHYAAISQKLTGLALDVRLIKESELGIDTLPQDHLIRNTYLRHKLYAQAIIEANFIAFDDDSLVIKQVDLSDFIDHGKHKAYYFYDQGKNWLGAYPVATSFDLGLWRTVKFLTNSGYDTRLYNSHMPQIINKKIANVILNRTAGLGLDEWSSYFNMAKYLYPQYFSDYRYRTIAWPPNLDSWLPSVPPENIVFQNYYQSDVDLVKKSPKKITQKLHNWLAEYHEKKRIQQSMLPVNPEVTISNTGLSFNATAISCRKQAKIYIKLNVEIAQFQFQCRYDMHEIAFSNDSLPRYLLIPAHLFNQKTENTIKISVSLNHTGEVFELLIPLTIDQ